MFKVVTSGFNWSALPQLVNSSVWIMEADFENLIAGFIENKIGISEHFLNAELCEHLSSNLLLLHKDNELQSARVGNDSLLQHSQKIRKDKIY